MSSALVYALTAGVLIAIGFFGFVTRRHFLRQILAANVIGSGVFLLFGALAHRAGEAAADPVPQAMIITGIVVAMSTTALAAALLARLHEHTGSGVLPDRLEEDEDG